ncbi:hypothetical protein SNEBB_006318 [Seison nebaliae]|nr:hypothetical protein SNEBB_006318 [Seison nebaliae]
MEISKDSWCISKELNDYLNSGNKLEINRYSSTRNGKKRRSIFSSVRPILIKKELTDDLTINGKRYDLNQSIDMEIDERNRINHLPSNDKKEMSTVELQNLIKCGALRKAFNLTTAILSAHHHDSTESSHEVYEAPIFTAYSFQIWLIRVSIMMKRRMYHEIDQELRSFGEFQCPFFYYRHYGEQYLNSNGCMIPYDLRLISIEAAYRSSNSYKGKMARSITKFYRLIDICSKLLNVIERSIESITQSKTEIESENEKKFNELLSVKECWKKRKARTCLLLANIYMEKEMIEDAINLIIEVKKMEIYSIESVTLILGRFLLSMNLPNEAQKIFEEIDKTQFPDLYNFNIGCLEFVRQNYSEALDNFEKVLESETISDKLKIESLTNKATTLLYMHRLADGIHLLENAIKDDPRMYLCSQLIYNLSTFYELESTDGSEYKKRLWENTSNFIIDINLLHAYRITKN